MSGCGCSANKIAVRADGATVTCWILAHMVLGWIDRDSLAEVWQTSQDACVRRFLEEGSTIPDAGSSVDVVTAAEAHA